MANKFRVVVMIEGEEDTECIVDEAFLADSVDQISSCKPEGVRRIDAVYVGEVGKAAVSDESVWLELISMRDNLREAIAHHADSA